MTSETTTVPPFGGLRLVASNPHIEPRTNRSAPHGDRAAAAACMARLLRVTAILERRGELDRVEADRVLAFFAEISVGVRDQAADDAVALDFLRQHRQFANFVLYGELDAVFEAAAQARPAARGAASLTING